MYYHKYLPMCSRGNCVHHVCAVYDDTDHTSIYHMYITYQVSVMHALSSSTVLPPKCDHSTGAMTVYCYSCNMYCHEDHAKGGYHKKQCRTNWARMVLTLAEEAQEQLIVDYLIAASLSKAFLSTLVLCTRSETLMAGLHPDQL